MEQKKKKKKERERESDEGGCICRSLLWSDSSYWYRSRYRLFRLI